MAQTTKLQYWDGSRWRIPIREGQNAYLGCILEEEVGKPRFLIANLLNTPLNPFSSTVSERIGYFNSTFTEFMDVRLVNTENHSIMFAGKIYKIEERTEEASGSKLMLTCFDSLKQLTDFQTDSWRHTADNLEGFSDDLTKRSDIITRAIRNAGIIDIEDTINSDHEFSKNSSAKFTNSPTLMGSSNKTDLTKDSSSLLSSVSKLAVSEPHSHTTALTAGINTSVATIVVEDTSGFPTAGKILIGTEIIQYTGLTLGTSFTGCVRGSDNTTAASHSDNDVVKLLFEGNHGFNYYADPNVKTAQQNVPAPPQTLNYFQRNTRPSTNAGGAPLKAKSLTVAYTTDAGYSVTDHNSQNQTMATTIYGPHTYDDTTFMLANATTFPSDGGVIYVGDEYIEYGSHNSQVPTTLSNCVRGSGADSIPKTASGSLLAEALDDSETDIDVDDGTDFAQGNVIQVKDERMFVTGISSNTLTVTRAYDGTTAVTHDDNTVVYIVGTTAAAYTHGKTVYYVSKAKALMYPSFLFTEPKDELFTEAVVYYPETGLSDVSIPSGHTKHKTFDLLYAREISGEYHWRDLLFEGDEFISAGDTLLAEALDDSETDVTVDRADAFQVGDVIKIDNEEMLITNIGGGNVLTVVRDYNATTAASHSDNATITIKKAPEFLKLSYDNGNNFIGIKKWEIIQSPTSSGIGGYLGSATNEICRVQHQTSITAATNGYVLISDLPRVSTTLNTALTSSASSVVLKDATLYDGDDFPNLHCMLRIGKEDIIVSSLSTRTYTVAKRGANGTTATEHAAGSRVDLIFFPPIEQQLNEDLDDSETTITLDDASDLPSAGGAILIDNEIITYTGISSENLTGCTRGVGSTVAAAHDDNTKVYLLTKMVGNTSAITSYIKPKEGRLREKYGMPRVGRIRLGTVNSKKDIRETIVTNLKSSHQNEKNRGIFSIPKYPFSSIVGKTSNLSTGHGVDIALLSNSAHYIDPREWGIKTGMAIEKYEDINFTKDPAINVLRTAISSSTAMTGSGTIDVNSTAAFPDSGTFQINNEIFDYSGKTVNTFTGVQRNEAHTYTPDDDHAVGAVVTEVWPHAYISDVLDDRTDKTASASGAIQGIQINGRTTEEWTDDTALAAGQFVKIHVPIRTGDLIRVDNDLANIDTDHVISRLVFRDMEGQVGTSIETVKKDTSLNILYPNFTEGLYNEMLERSIYHSKRDRSQQKFALGKDTNEPMHISNMSPSGSLLNGAIANTTDTTVTVDNGAHFSAGQILCVSNATASEHMVVTNVSSNDLTVVRAFNGSSAHADDVAVFVQRAKEIRWGYSSSQPHKEQSAASRTLILDTGEEYVIRAGSTKDSDMLNGDMGLNSHYILYWNDEHPNEFQVQTIIDWTSTDFPQDSVVIGIIKGGQANQNSATGAEVATIHDFATNKIQPVTYDAKFVDADTEHSHLFHF